MGKIYSKALDEHLKVDRIIGQIEGEKPGPCLIFIGGIHGNEPSGVFALHKVMQELKDNNIAIRGTVIALTGNLWALKSSERFHQADLNRLWLSESVKSLKNGTFEPDNEDEKQQAELYGIIKNLLSTKSGPFYFFDLHTTSSKSTPFLTVNDSLLNRKFTQQYPVPMILGIEEFLDGPLLSYINELGYVSFGFESGQHDEISSVNNHIAFTYLSLVFSGAVAKESINFLKYFKSLGNMTGSIYEIYHQYKIHRDEIFVMEPDFVNFQSIAKGRLLATSNDQPVVATEHAIIFMPLYQELGDDGFFIIRRIRPIYLKLSAIFRKLHVDRILHILPGIRKSSVNNDTLILNLKIARFFTKHFLHIFGYRINKKQKTHLNIKSREANSKKKDYNEAPWYKKRHLSKPKLH
jgi:succinylglutamate desuccinylase